VEEAIKLWQQLATLHRAKADVKKAYSEFSTVDIEIETREQKIKAEKEKVGLQIEVDKLKLEVEKAGLLRKKQEFENAKKAEGQKPSPDERILQSARDKLKTMKATGEAMGLIKEDRDRVLKDIDPTKNPELCRKIKHMYDNLMMDLTEGRER
jgi:hypothetical protein